ncbi:methylaminobutanoate oxidase [Seminavis robusta]|uniref:Methylaminobutanoate oxidase n=1 Tax=Seminavis robusta TaxID=568900 RepID=A0A9N8HL47_9STRA|nr:methylaminobutanoate oxidase [Seminavis robusta]|eukprot:Sro781_g201580.1 methylaminobutanoate oxidase (892) ;mRNA; f:27157-29996
MFQARICRSRLFRWQLASGSPQLKRAKIPPNGRLPVTQNFIPGFATLFSLTSERQFSTLKKIPPSQANVVVVGGGIIGTSVAYHLGKSGVADVILLEQDALTSGTTWHAAGLVNTFGSMSETSINMRRYTRDLYANILPEETDQDAGFRDVGFIELACDPDRLYYYRKVAAFNRYLGVDVREISPEQVKELFPLCETSDVLAGFHVPTDGRVNPVDATMALKKAATKLYGVEVFEKSRVARVAKDYSRGSVLPHVTGVELESGHEIQANVVVNCAGMWARTLGESCGVDTIPNQAAEHYYVITDAMPEVDPSWPVIEDSSKCVYIRPEGAGLLVGLFEWDGASWNSDKDIPKDFSFGQLDPDWERLGPYIEEAYQRVPACQDVGIQALFCGPESFTPDNMPVMGEAPYLQNFYVAAGMNSLGITQGGGVGKIMAEWIQKGHPPLDWDVTGININRFHSYQTNPEYRKARAGDALGHTYKVHYPDSQYHSARNAKQSIFHERLLEKGAYMKSVSGWESPGWYNNDRGSNEPLQHSFGRESWFPQWEAEHMACRNNVVLFDMSFMSKFLVQGCDAGSFLNRLSTAKVAGEDNKITYTQWLNEQGTIEADLTVTQLSPQEFIVVATDTMHHHVLSHMKRRLSRDIHATVTDITGQYAQLNLQGPQSRSLLQQLTTTDLSTESFPFRHATTIDIGLARVLCMRITYVGELGYELFIPTEQALHVYDRIQSIGVQSAGLRALGSLRMEKGYRDYGHDIDGTDTVLQAGLGFTCDFNKDSGFIGMEQVLQEKAQSKEQGGLQVKMAQILVTDPEPLLSHGEVLWRDGQRISEIRASSYGHFLNGAVGLAMIQAPSGFRVNKDFIKSGDWQIEIANKRFPCQLSFAPMYDPKSLKVKV